MNIIYQYTRAEAIADGVLIDVTETAAEAGVRHPVAVTRAVWEKYVVVPEGVSGQDEAGRLWDIVWMFRCKAASSGAAVSQLRFQLYVRNTNGRPRLVELKAVCSPGDDPRPVITIMLPGED